MSVLYNLRKFRLTMYVEVELVTVYKKRIIQLLILFIAVMFIFIFRLAYVQLIATSHYSKHEVDLIKESINQRTQTFILHSGRGYFTDRNGHPLNSDYYPSLILFPFLNFQQWPVNKVAEIVKIDKLTILEAIMNQQEPIVLQENGRPIRLTEAQMKNINKLKIPGVFAQYVQQRTENIAPHLIGVTGENTNEVKRRYEEEVVNGRISVHSEIGVSGMQRAFDPFLISHGDSKLAFFVDNHKQPLFGFDVNYVAPANPYHPTEVVTTIDKEIQEYVTKALKEEGVTKGGAVILDAKTSDLVSLVSLPTFDVNFPFDSGAKNHITSSYTPGSIFKIVVAAAAIDLNLTNKFDLYDCNKNLYGDKEEPRQLGMLTFKESFAQSCNYTFSFLANELIQIDDQILDKYAMKLGLINHIGWKGDVFRLKDLAHFPEEEQGIISINEINSNDKYEIAQTAIGQKNVRVTPLAVANMLATIARGGEKKQVRGASKVKYENGTTVVEFPIKSPKEEDRISRYTAMRLQELLRGVVKIEQGTAFGLLNKSPMSIAGKTGTAETGENKEGRSHWFAGYFPADHPKYVMVILDLDHKNGNIKTLKAYEKIVQFLYNYEK